MPILTANLGFRNNLNNCRLLKCISSGNSHSSRRFFDSEVPFFLDRFEEADFDEEDSGRVMADFVAGAKRVLEDCAAVSEVKSMVKGAFAALVVLAVGVPGGAASVMSASPAQLADERAGRLPLRVTFLNFQCSAPAQALPKPLSK